MKLFQQLLVAPAALGLIASGANAAELNINGVSDYATSADQVTSVTQFSTATKLKAKTVWVTTTTPAAKRVPVMLTTLSTAPSPSATTCVSA